MAGDHDSATTDQRAVVAHLMSAVALDGETETAVVLLTRQCRAAARYLSVERVIVGLMSERGSAGVAGSADTRNFALDEMSLGEGPSHDAFRSRRPVLVADLASPNGRAWPAYSASALESGVNDVLAFPLHIGAAAFEVLSIYLTDAGPTGGDEMNMALTFAGIATRHSAGPGRRP